MSGVRNWPKSKAPVGALGSLTSMPSTTTFTWLELVPAHEDRGLAAGPPVWTTLRPGTSFSTSDRVVCCLRAMSPAVTSVVVLATAASSVGTRLAVTTTALTPEASGAGGPAVWAKAALAAMEADNDVAAKNLITRKPPARLATSGRSLRPERSPRRPDASGARASARHAYRGGSHRRVRRSDGVSVPRPSPGPGKSDPHRPVSWLAGRHAACAFPRAQEPQWPRPGAKDRIVVQAALAAHSCRDSPGSEALWSPLPCSRRALSGAGAKSGPKPRAFVRPSLPGVQPFL